MKRLLVILVSTTLLTVGWSMKTNANETASKGTNGTTPNDVYNLARNGYFLDEGIPSHGGLTSAYRLGNVTAEDLVNAAIQQNRLFPETLQNRLFIRAVDRYLLDDASGD